MANSQVQQNQIPNEPSLRDLLDLLKKDILLNFNSHHIGTVQSFNASNQTATVTINYKKTFFQLNTLKSVYEPVLVDYPLIIDAPVIVLGGGNACLTFPISKGDECLVFFNDRDLDNWFQGNSSGGVATPRLHSFSDGIILVGINSLPRVWDNYDTTRASLKNGDAQVSVGEILVKIANNSFTLNGVLQELLTELQNLTTALAALTVTGVTPGGGVSGVPVNAATITAIGTQLSATALKIAGLLE